MYKKLAVAIIHGIGEQTEGYAEKTIALINKKFSEKLNRLVEDPSSYLIIQPIVWSQVFAERERDLFKKTVLENHLRYQDLRKFVIQYVGDVVAYQPVETAGHNYEKVHEMIGESLNLLANEAGDDAPLCVISHSLGSVIASNYVYDLQMKKGDARSLSPLEKGDTLTLFYTLGTTLPLWSLRYYNFNRPINIPSKELRNFYPGLKGEWINFYDKDDILGYPLKGVSENYNLAVDEDRKVNVGGLFTSWNPLCHKKYFKDKDVIDPIVDGLVRTWRQINNM
ncbi:chemotaxis protein [Sporosarcina sp. Marseille-Q4063]|uniref:chemotaxis protein n=1 Tax=Sporosarcina sp. Marseille-Q4063 TaxID=2810514 RepID=UPI001BB0900B|nr:chemotaxis protein [Sporosarcina sp. Marseille-Q4063]QUW23546.1 chemotaxis protein [Sporosarcina sp. Marseille-Q4063]